MTVSELREQGYDVRFSHFRLTESHSRLLAVTGERLKTTHPELVEAPFALREAKKPIGCKGGYTHCTILKDDKVVAEGDAWCNPEMDNFSKAIGRQVALGRAVKNLTVELSELVSGLCPTCGRMIPNCICERSDTTTS